MSVTIETQTGVAGIRTGFAGIVGEQRVSSDPEACTAFAVDGLVPRCVVYPPSAEQVAEALKYAASLNLAVIPSRNGTKLGIGAPPRRYDVALSLKELNQVWYYEPDDLVVSVEPGMKFGDLQHFLARHKLWIPLDPAGGERASVGGILAANSAGPFRLRYGGPRDMILGMRIATVDGKIAKTGGRVVKNVAGYDLAKLLIGSFGMLGVILEATFKLYPQAPERATWVMAPPTINVAREFRRKLLQSPLRPLRVVLLNASARALLAERAAETAVWEGARQASDVVRETGPEIWIEAGGSERVIARYASDLDSLAASLKSPIRRADGEDAARVWERVADFGLWFTRDRQNAVVLKATLLISSAEEFLERAEKEAQIAGCEAPGIVQIGVGIAEIGLVRTYQIASDARTPSHDLIQSLRDAAHALGGRLVMTRCPAELKAKVDVWGPPRDDFEVMRKLKSALDPKGTLAPGRVVGGL